MRKPDWQNTTTFSLKDLKKCWSRLNDRDKNPEQGTLCVSAETYNAWINGEENVLFFIYGAPDEATKKEWNERET